MPCDICAAKDGICPPEASCSILGGQQMCINVLFKSKVLILELL